MMRFLSPGFKVRTKVAELLPKPKGRPKATAVEGGLQLGEKRPRLCGNKKLLEDEQMMKELERRLELLETVQAQEVSSDEKVQKVLILHDEAEEENNHLRGLLLNRHSGGAFDTPDRKPSAGLASPESGEIPLQGPGRCEAAGKHFGILGSCEAAWRGGKEGGA